MMTIHHHLRFTNHERRNWPHQKSLSMRNCSHTHVTNLLVTTPLVFARLIVFLQVQMLRLRWLNKSVLCLACWLFGMAACRAEVPANGLQWPEGRVFPQFAAPAEQLDALNLHDLTPDEQLTFSALAGQVNRRQPRIVLVNRRPNEKPGNSGPEQWLRTPTINLSIGRRFDSFDKYALLAKYAKEFRGLVLYDPTRNPHLRNLAATVAAIERLAGDARSCDGNREHRH